MNYLLVAIPVLLLVLNNAMLFVNWRRAERRAAAWEKEARRFLDYGPKS